MKLNSVLYQPDVAQPVSNRYRICRWATLQALTACRCTFEGQTVQMNHDWPLESNGHLSFVPSFAQERFTSRAPCLPDFVDLQWFRNFSLILCASTLTVKTPWLNWLFFSCDLKRETQSWVSTGCLILKFDHILYTVPVSDFIWSVQLWHSFRQTPAMYSLQCRTERRFSDTADRVRPTAWTSRLTASPESETGSKCLQDKTITKTNNT